MGYGYRLGVDLPGESRGFIPNDRFYNKIYGKGHWSANTIISVSIGQGEIGATPVQIANLCATIANRGWFITPHVVKAVSDTVMDKELLRVRRPTIEPRYYREVAEGMRMAVTGGTCRRGAIPGIEMAGKPVRHKTRTARTTALSSDSPPMTIPKLRYAYTSKTPDSALLSASP